MRWAVSLATLLLAAAAAAGCMNNSIVPVEQDAELRRVKAEAPQPLPLKLAVAPVRWDFDRDEINKRADQDYRYAVPSDAGALRAEFVKVIQEYGAFSEVTTVDGANLDECIDKAFADGKDLVLDLDFRRFDVNWEEANGWYALNLINFALFVWTAWWVTDEIYAGNIDLDWALMSAHSSLQVFSPGVYEEKAKRELDDFERGWKLTGSIFIPSGLKPENWQKIHQVVMPHALRNVYRRMMSDFDKDFYAKATDPQGVFAKEMAKTMAVAVGVSRHEDFLIHNLRYSDGDARAFSDFLKAKEGPFIPEKNIRLFENHTATLANVRDTFENFIKKYCRADDTVIIYFAGYGAVEKSSAGGGDGTKKFLVLADTQVDRMSDSALSLDELDAFCDSLPAKNVIVVLDTSFGQGGETRTYVDARKPAEERQLTEDFLKKLSDKPGRIVLSACQPNEGALMLDEEQRGLFTHSLLQAVASLAKQRAGSDRPYVTLADAFQAAVPNVRDSADIEGQPQSPGLFGSGAESIPLVLLGERAPAEGSEGTAKEKTASDGHKPPPAGS